MRYVVLILASIFFSDIASSQSILVGTWVSDKDKTREFNIKNSKLTESQLGYLMNNIGHAYLTFSEKSMCRVFEEYNVTRGGKDKINERMSWNFEYSVIGSEDGIVFINFKKADSTPKRDRVETG